MHALMQYICDELEELERKVDKGAKLSMAEIEYMDTLAHTKKNLLKAEEMSDNGYSERMYPRYDDGHYYRGGSYNDGRSYARGRGRNARRDSMGRYSSGYSMADDEMMSELHELMEKAPDEQTKKEFRKFIEKIEMM